jgi:hypothetical protein
VEVELDQLVARSADVDRAPGRVVHLDRVAVVDQLQRRGLVVELDRRQVGRLGAADVDRRLHLAELAARERLVEPAPFGRAAVLAVRPVVAFGVHREGADQRDDGDSGTDCVDEIHGKPLASGLVPQTRSI